MNKNHVEYIKKYLPKNDWDRGINDLSKGISPQYVVGNVNFYGYIIDVDSRVLIPRFETELLVEKTLSYIKKKFKRQIKVLDICTGSGCIAISIKKETDCIMYASDISSEALDLARSNAKKNNVDINFILSDLFSNVNEKFDVIISNPPYISFDEDVEDIVKNNEPSIALFASDNGLYFYKQILMNCSERLSEKFLIAFEIGYKQGNVVKNMAYKFLGNDVYVCIEKDYSNKDRFVFIYNF